MSYFIDEPRNLFIYQLCFTKTLFSIIDYHLLLNFFVLQSTLLVVQERLTLRILGLELHRNSVLTELTIAHNVQNHNKVASHWILSTTSYINIRHQKYAKLSLVYMYTFSLLHGTFIIVPSNFV